MKITAVYNKPKGQMEAAADAVATFPQRGENVVLTSFVNNALPSKDGQPRLDFLQTRRSLKWQEVLHRVQLLVDLTDSKEFVIEHGQLVGSYLLGQIRRVLPAAVYFYGFDAAKWPLLEENATGDITVRVFAGEAPATVTGVVIDAFRREKKIKLPDFVLRAVDPTTDLSYLQRRKLLSLQKYFVLLDTLERLGAEAVVLTHCSQVDTDMLRSLLSCFERIEYSGFPDEYFADPRPNLTEGILKLKEKFSL